MNNFELGLMPDRNEVVCSKCRGMMLIKGQGRFICEDCGNEYVNDYGKIRQYLEKRGRATVQEVSIWTGISVTKVLALLKQGRIMLTPDSNIKLHCECCGKVIRHGNLCERCEEQVGRRTQATDKEGKPVETSQGTFNMISYDMGMGMRFVNNRGVRQIHNELRRGR